MANWNKSDYGKVIVFRDVKGLDNKVAVHSSNPLVPNTVGVIEYPIFLNSKIVFEVGVPKNQEVKSQEYLKKAGDWYFVGFVSKDEKEELERISAIPKMQYEEDLRDWSEFHTYPVN